MQSKSRFDTGNWSIVNGLPGQQDMLNYLEFLGAQDPNKCHTRRQLMDSVAKEFEIPADAQEAEGPQSKTSGYYTRLTYLISDAVYGVRRADGKPFLKRIRFNVYQHVTGNGVVSPEMLEYLKRHHRQDEGICIETPYEEALHFFKHARKINFAPETARTLLPDKWDTVTLERALTAAYA